MEIRIFKKESDLEAVNSWLPFKVRAEELPAHTFCAVMDGQIIAIAGLRLVEGEICFLDSMGSNQKVEGSFRNEALDLLINTLLEKARELRFKYAKGCTADSSVMARVERHGFKKVEQVIVIKEL